MIWWQDLVQSFGEDLPGLRYLEAQSRLYTSLRFNDSYPPPSSFSPPELNAASIRTTCSAIEAVASPWEWEPDYERRDSVIGIITDTLMALQQVAGAFSRFTINGSAHDFYWRIGLVWDSGVVDSEPVLYSFMLSESDVYASMSNRSLHRVIQLRVRSAMEQHSPGSTQFVPQSVADTLAYMQRQSYMAYGNEMTRRQFRGMSSGTCDALDDFLPLHQTYTPEAQERACLVLAEVAQRYGFRSVFSGHAWQRSGEGLNIEISDDGRACIDGTLVCIQLAEYAEVFPYDTDQRPRVCEPLTPTQQRADMPPADIAVARLLHIATPLRNRIHTLDGYRAQLERLFGDSHEEQPSASCHADGESGAVAVWQPITMSESFQLLQESIQQLGEQIVASLGISFVEACANIEQALNAVQAAALERVGIERSGDNGDQTDGEASGQERACGGNNHARRGEVVELRRQAWAGYSGGGAGCGLHAARNRNREDRSGQVRRWWPTGGNRSRC